MSLKILNEGFNKYFKSLNEEKCEERDLLKESRQRGFVRKYKGCSIHYEGYTYVVTNEYGLNIGQSPTESGCEGIIDEYVKEKYGREPITQEFIGLPISEARQKLGYWYVLDSQNVPVGSRKATYTFKRAGYPTVVLYTLNGKVQKVSGEIYSSGNTRKNEGLKESHKEDKKCEEKCTDEACDKKDVKKKLKESEASQDISEYQKWVDYDMKKYKRISDETMNKIKKAGFSVVKDQYGDYEVIADRPIKESKKSLDDIDAIADDRKERAKKAFARAKDDADSRRDYMKKKDMKESCKRSKKKLKESLTNSPYKALIGEQFDHTFDFDFLDVVADLLDRIDFDAENIDEEIYSAIDEGLIYYADQWKVIQFYQTPEQANFNEAIEDLTGDLIELCNKIIESKE